MILTLFAGVFMTSMPRHGSAIYNIIDCTYHIPGGSSSINMMLRVRVDSGPAGGATGWWGSPHLLLLCSSSILYCQPSKCFKVALFRGTLWNRRYWSGAEFSRLKLNHRCLCSLFYSYSCRCSLSNSPWTVRLFNFLFSILSVFSVQLF